MVKKTSLLITLSILVILTSCNVQVKDDLKSVSKFEQSDLYGHWVQTNKGDEIENSDFGTVTKFNLNDDLTAEIEIIDSLGFRTVIGKWEIKKKKRLGSDKLNVTFQSDVIVKFQKDKTHLEYLSLMLNELNNKKVLTADDVIYSKK